MDNLRFEQNRLRHDLIEEIKKYLGYAEDVHADYISVNEITFDVDFRSRNDDFLIINPDTTITREEFEKLK